VYPEHLMEYIPPTFDINKYQKAADLPIELWMINIFVKLFGYKAYEAKIDVSLVSEPDLNKVIPALENLMVDGVITEFDDLSRLMIHGFLDMDKAQYTAQVRELTYYDLFTIIEELKDGEMEKLYLENGKSITPPMAMLLQSKLGKLNETLDIYDKYWGNSSSSLLKVDLDSSDSELKSAFDEWLKQKRKMTRNETLLRRSYKLKNLNQTTFRKWYDARVLAYMDLVTWNYMHGNIMTSKIIGDILFPEQRDLKDTTAVINDTVKPLVAKLTNIVTIKRMIKVYAESNRKKII